MWPFDLFKKKEPVAPLATEAHHAHQGQHIHHGHGPSGHALKAHAKPYSKIRQVGDPGRDRKSDDEDITPAIVGNFLMGQLLDSSPAPAVELSPDNTPASFEGFGGGTSGGGGASGSWDAPSSSDSSPSPDPSSSMDSSSFDSPASTPDFGSSDGGSSGGDFSL
jgi:hypothetical protein